jgi:hypothetical protein
MTQFILLLTSKFMALFNKKQAEAEAPKEVAQENILTSIALFAGSWSQLNVFDFSMLNLRFVAFRSEEFTKLIADHEYHKGQLTGMLESLEGEHLDLDRYQALVPIDFSIPVPPEALWQVRNILLIIFPSDITISRLIEFQLFGDKLLLSSIETYPFTSTGDGMFDNYLTYYDPEVENINQFIPVYLERCDTIPYLESTINAYLSSYFQNFKNMEYLSLCIALESIVDGKTELIYRIRRNVAILISGDIDLAKQVFKNIAEIYSLRSSIVHSSTVNYEKLKEYLPYLRKVISRIITELISLNIADLATLNTQLTFYGVEDRYKLAAGYVDYPLHLSVKAGAVAQELSKYK